ncbi:hypothetical protein Aperf_G00000066535 [Anoplocephala perfoliata]
MSSKGSLVREESPPRREAINELMPSKAVPLVICGPSGSGKSSIIKQLLLRNPDIFQVCISHTTRQRRPNEIDGKDYIFVTKQEFQEAIKRNEFVEYAVFSGNYYGTSKAQMEKVIQAGKVCIFELDTQGVEQIRKMEIRPICVFIRPRNYAVLEKRLRTHSVESEEHILQRLAVAHHEMQYALDEEIFNKVVTNENLDAAVREIEFLLQQDERLQYLFNGPWKTNN